jgi:hypothetical protein
LVGQAARSDFLACWHGILEIQHHGVGSETPYFREFAGLIAGGEE